MATAAEVNEKLDTLTATLNTVAGETASLLQKIQELQDAAQNGEVPDEILTKINSILEQAQRVDDLVPAVENPTP